MDTFQQLQQETMALIERRNAEYRKVAILKNAGQQRSNAAQWIGIIERAIGGIQEQIDFNIAFMERLATEPERDYEWTMADASPRGQL